MKLAVASGKGGTGKSMMATNLAFTLAWTGQVTLVDCDVEEPNLHLFFPAPATTRDVTMPVPVVNESLCDHCGKCGKFCQYGALTVLPDRVLFFPELCHSCGGCRLVCPKNAIREEPKKIGTLSTSAPMPGLTLVSGTLDEGSPHAVPVIRDAKKHAARGPVVILDTAPGTSCPVVEALEGCDACILVTESTPFGLHDLQLAVDVAARLGIPAGIVINRSDGNDRETLRFCTDHDLEVMMTVPFDREIAAIQSRGDLLCRVKPEWQKDFWALFAKCRALTGVDG
ncbi:MAG: ATP-binding protein [Methanoregula sp.]|jgi:MinD superfamily P-loop ATPase|uniref:ATP-binding protein n=1 Tax=Methanoregula sp. TaxID=2052170 RepID=UPI0025FD29F6|nr:ATP-binding protein [Methanoregula sp.]MCK9632228.1 ATP-binding protein [Methanoregula sp.]